MYFYCGIGYIVRTAAHAVPFREGTHMGIGFGRILPFAAAALLAITLMASMPGADSNADSILGAPGDHNADDVAVINGIIDNNGLNWTKAVPADGSYIPANWTGITWSGAPGSTDRRIIELKMNSKNLSGDLDVSRLTALEDLSCHNNYLRKVDVSGLTALRSLHCWDNRLTELDVSGCTGLRMLHCEVNKLTELDVSGCTGLRELSCHTNLLTELDLSGLTNLLIVYCSNNRLTSLNVSGCIIMDYLACSNNNLTELDVSDCQLTRLYCGGNPLTKGSVKGVENWDSSNFYIDPEPRDPMGIMAVLIVGAAMVLMALIAFIIIFRRKDKKI